MSTDIVTTNGHGMTVADTISVAQHLAQSGYFRDAADVSKAVAKILYGQALGIAPVQSMMGVDIIEGKPAPSAGLVAALVKRSGRYDYRVVDADADPVVIEWTDRGKVIGRSSFGTEDAKRAGLAGKQNYQRWPKAMRFSRALTSGARMYAPDVFLGPVYTPDELDEGIPVDTGEVVTTTARPVPGPVQTRQEPPAAAAAPQTRPAGNGGSNGHQEPDRKPAGTGPNDVTHWIDIYTRCTNMDDVTAADTALATAPVRFQRKPEVIAAREKAVAEISAAAADWTDADLTPDDALAPGLTEAESAAELAAAAAADREVIEGFVAAAQAEVGP